MLSDKVVNALLSALGSNEARVELVNAINSAGGSGISTLTGDVSASGSGSVAATVNSIGGAIASNSNTPSTIVKRDSSGNFSAGTITASLTGHASLDLPLSGGTMSGAIAMGNSKITGLGTPTLVGDAATKAYVDSVASNILVFTSTATVGGAAAEAVTVTGLLNTDTILSVSQKTGGGSALPILGWSTQITNGITVIYSADMGPGAVVLVAVKR